MNAFICSRPLSLSLSSFLCYSSPSTPPPASIHLSRVLYFCLSSSARLTGVFSCLLFLSCSLSPSSPPPPNTPQGSCSNSVLLHQPTFLLPLIGLYTLLGCRDVTAHLLIHLQTNPFFFFFLFQNTTFKDFTQNCHEKKITIAL